MKTSYFTYIFFVYCICLSACQEIYETNISPASPVLVVQSLLKNTKEGCVVKLSYTSNFTDNSKSVPATGAKLKLTENDNVIYDFTETALGEYSTDSLVFCGKSGNKYQLQITTTDGKIYESMPCYMPLSPKVDSIWVQNEKYTYLKPDDYGGFVRVSEPFPYIYTCFRSPDKQNGFFNIRQEIILISSRTKYRNPRGSMPNKTWTIYYYKRWNSVTTFDIAKGDILNDSMTVKKYQICRILKRELRKEDDYHDAEVLIGWYLKGFYHTISEETYKYYSIVNQQLEATNSIFDPIATQITGNITCKNADVPVLGNFEVSACLSDYTFILNVPEYWIFPVIYNPSIWKDFYDSDIVKEDSATMDGTKPDWYPKYIRNR